MSALKSTRPMQLLDGKALLTTEEAAKFLNISRTTLVRLTERKKLVRVKIGTLNQYPVEDLIAFVRSRR